MDNSALEQLPVKLYPIVFFDEGLRVPSFVAIDMLLGDGEQHGELYQRAIERAKLVLKMVEIQRLAQSLDPTVMLWMNQFFETDLHDPNFIGSFISDNDSFAILTLHEAILRQAEIATK